MVSVADTFKLNRVPSSRPLEGDAPQVSEAMASAAWLSAGAVTAAVMVMFLHGGFGGGSSKPLGK